MNMLAATVVLIFLAFAGCGSSQKAQSSGPAFPPVPVSTGEATEESVAIEIHSVGNVESYSTVEVKAQVAGQLLAVKFPEGSNVSSGDLLFESDPQRFQEAWRQAVDAVAKEDDQLR